MITLYYRDVVCVGTVLSILSCGSSGTPVVLAKAKVQRERMWLVVASIVPGLLDLREKIKDTVRSSLERIVIS